MKFCSERDDGARTDRPHLDGSDLVVDGVRFIVLGAEIHNSSSSTAEAIHASFARVRALGANTVLAPVAWDLFEPEEGVFDSTLVDEMLAACAREGLRLIPLWFGAWKNGRSSYAPAWVKTDTERFPRADMPGHRAFEHLTPFSPETRRADAAAFRALMAHLAAVDTTARTIMVQVENEVGLLGASRDRSIQAEAAWNSPMPSNVIEAIAAAPMIPAHEEWQRECSRRIGSWPEILGDTPNAHEAFMAHAYAQHIEAVAAAGRRELSVPLFVNAWLDNPPDTPGAADASDVAFAGGALPGSYPSGGPLPRVAPIWSAAAPTIDLFAPDVYFGDVEQIYTSFRQVRNRLFIPEMRRSALGVGHMFLAIGEHRAIGTSPFGVDSIAPGDPDEHVLSDGYALLRHAAQLWSETPDAHARAFLLTEPGQSREFDFGPYRVTVDTSDAFGIRAPVFPAYGILLDEGDGRIVAIGRGFRMGFAHVGGRNAGILSAHELRQDRSGGSRVVSHWNGDETASGSSIRIPALVDRVDETFPIATMRTSTGVVRIRLYAY